MSLEIKDRAMVPPGGWDYVQEVTVNGVIVNHKLVSNNLAQLEKKVRTFRKANGIPESKELRHEIIENLCDRRPELCRDTKEERPVGRIASFARAMLGWANQGFKTVPEPDLHQRQEICLACEYWKGWRTAGIGICGKCGCPAGRVTLKLYIPDQECPIGKWKKVNL